jgi:hypothetical protein
VSLGVFSDYVLSVSGGERLDWYAAPFLRAEWNSGESFFAFAQKGRSFVDEEFDLADRLPVPVGDYDANWTGIDFGTSPSRPISARVGFSWQDAYGGQLTTHGGRLQAALGSHLKASVGYERSTADIPSGSFVANVLSVRLGYAFSTRMAAGAYVQWNSLDENVVANLRFVYRHRPGSDFIVALNEERGALGSLWTVAERHLAVKINYLARF